MSSPDNSVPRQDEGLQQQLLDIDIPPRPKIIDRICAEMTREAPNLRDVAHWVSQDVGLAAGLIKAANSPYTGFPGRARSVYDALSLLGLDATSHAVAALCLRRAFPNTAQFERFWHASAQIAALSAWLARRLGAPQVQANDAYTFGLFRDCGIAILLLRFSDYRTVLAQANSDETKSFTEIERASLPTDHTAIGSLLAQNWWLPEITRLAIRHHHDLNRLDLQGDPLPVGSRRLVALAQTAEYLVQKITGGSQTREWAKFGPTCMHLLDIDDTAITESIPEATELLREID